MTIALLDAQVRLALAIAVAVLIAAAWFLGRRGKASIASALAILAVGCVGVLAAEALVALTVRLAAPRAADFNEFRWVFLAPWGRLGLWLGIAAVAAIGALAYWSSRGVSP